MMEMEYRQLGSNGPAVSVIALGCWAFAGDANWGPQEDRESFNTIDCALDCGINLFDTAEAYGSGRSEEVLGKGLQGKRDGVIIASKAAASHLDKQSLVSACEASLRRLQTDYIDIYQLHWPSREVPIEETMTAVDQLKQQGKIRYAGVCNFGKQDLTELAAVGHVVSNQLPYNLLWRALEYEVLASCIEHELGILCYSPLCQGLLTGKYRSPDEVPEGRARTRHFSSDRPGTRHGEPGCETATFAAVENIRTIAREAGMAMGILSLRWLLHQRGVTSILAGARSAEQVQENAASAAAQVPPNVLDKLTEATDELKELLGPNPDLWDDRFR